jgi:hypothetical protein
MTALPDPEGEILRRLDVGFPSTFWRRHRELRRKLQNNSLTVEEHRELLANTDRIEMADAERIAALAKLADLRGVPLLTVVQQFGMGGPGGPGITQEADGG